MSKTDDEIVREIEAEVIRIHADPGALAEETETVEADPVEVNGVRVTQAVMEEVQRAREGAYETLDDLSTGAREVLMRNDQWRREAAHAAHPGKDEQARRDRQRFFNLTRADAE